MIKTNIFFVGGGGGKCFKIPTNMYLNILTIFDYKLRVLLDFFKLFSIQNFLVGQKS